MINIAGIAVIGAFLLLMTALYRKDMLKSAFFPFLLLAVLFYQIGNFIEIASSTIEVANVGLKIRFIGIPFVPTLWYLCIREFCGLKFKRKFTIPLLMLVPLATAILAMTWESNHLLFADVIYLDGNFRGNPKLVPGSLFYLRLLYQYGINMIGLLTLVWQYRNGTRHFRKQFFLFLVSALIPFFNTSTYILNIRQQNIDVTPYGLIVSMLLISYGLYKFGVINQAGIIKENALDHVQEGVLLFDPEGIYMDCNKTARDLFPKLHKVPLGTNITEMTYLPFNFTALENAPQMNPVSEFTRESEGSIKTFGVSTAQIKFRRKHVGYAIILNNISPLKKTMDELEEKAIKDSLTKLYNRGYLFSVGESWAEKAQLSGEPLSAVMFDIDHFKEVNDTHGHTYGDYVLKEIAQVCLLGLRQSDILARYGGEEFCLLLLNTPIEGARNKAESLRAKIASHRFISDEIQTTVTASFGAASFDCETGEDNFSALLKRADGNLYRAKNGGRNRVC